MPSDDFCPECGHTIDDEPGYRVFPIAIPLAFRTSLGRGADAKDQAEQLITGAGTVAESDPDPCHLLAGTNSALAFSREGRITRVNDQRGSMFRGALGTASLSHGRLRFPNQWIDERYQNQHEGVQFEDVGPVEELGIVSPKTTDLIRIEPASVSPGLNLDPLASRGGVKAGYYSAAFIIRAVTAEQLDIDPEEVDISNVRQVRLTENEPVGEIVINDRLANGAGFSDWLYRNWANVLDSALNPPVDIKTFQSALISSSHQMSCDSSCYDCLRQYRNMNYHGLLDWRLGLAMVRCLSSESFSCGLDGDFDVPELSSWMAVATTLRDSFCASFDCEPRQFGQLPGLAVCRRDKYFYNMNSPTGQNEQLIATKQA